MSSQTEEYRGEDKANKAKIEAKNGLEFRCVAMRDTRAGERPKDKFEDGDNEMLLICQRQVLLNARQLSFARGQRPSVRDSACETAHLDIYSCTDIFVDSQLPHVTARDSHHDRKHSWTYLDDGSRNNPDEKHHASLTMSWMLRWSRRTYLKR